MPRWRRGSRLGIQVGVDGRAEDDDVIRTHANVLERLPRSDRLLHRGLCESFLSRGVEGVEIQAALVGLGALDDASLAKERREPLRVFTHDADDTAPWPIGRAEMGIDESEPRT